MSALDSTAVSVLVLLGLLLTSAFFSSTEIAFFSLSAEWLDERVTAGDGRASVVADLLEDPHRLLVTLLVGNNVVNVAISSILAVLFANHFAEGTAVLLTTVVASSVVLVFGEILPKSYGLGNAEEWSLRAARPVKLVERGLFPVVAVFDFITRRAGAAVGGDPDIEEPYTDDDTAKERSDTPANDGP
jgi:Mg2+/Co2+ transporter CorB